MSVPDPVLEGVRFILHRLATAFPATPTIDYPDSGTIWPTKNGVGLVVVIVNKPAVSYLLTVRDMTDGVDLPSPICPPPPVPSPFKVSVGGLISGHEYRIRIEVDPADVLANDLPHAVYVTAV
jgi:hypothetical protein